MNQQKLRILRERERERESQSLNQQLNGIWFFLLYQNYILNIEV